MLDPDLLRRAAMAGALGTELFVLAAGGAVLGYLLDQRWGTEPWLALSLGAIGMTFGTWILIRVGTKLINDDPPPPPESRPPDPS